LFAAGLLHLAAAPAAAADLGGAEWIWAPKYTRYTTPPGPRFFRKKVALGEVASAKLEITCDDQYELFINGRRVGAAGDWKTLKSHDVTTFVTPGTNIIAVRGDNAQLGAAGFVIRFTAKQKDGKLVTQLSDVTWKTSAQGPSGWEKIDFDDSAWETPRSWGTFSQVGPWGDRPRFPGEPPFTPNRFTPQRGFKVEEVVTPGQTGSLVNMAFNEHGDIIASRENGPLLLIRDKNGDGQFESVETYCDKIVNCQGILPLDGRVFAVGTGPAGTAMYRLSDSDGDRRADRVETVLKLTFIMSEHGPHAVVLGPDGLLYVMIGNHAGIEPKPAATSPFKNYYNTELLTPKYEDPTGHAAGLAAPGGIVVRTDQEGSFVEVFAGGFRNAFDIAVNRGGDMFTYDSDMEYDVGLPWYRPTRVNHITPAAEFGWRSGWTNWPQYYFDSLPALVNIGRGSPTGLEVYNHTRFPEKYHDALFMCDWSTGRVLAVPTRPAAGSYEATSEVFVEGRPLNCSDIAVGPDGWLYICVGGRGTQGSIFRVVTTDQKPAVAPAKPVEGIERAVRQPQLYSAWSRQKIAEVRSEMGERWATELHAVAHNRKATADDRTRALDLLQIFGPQPEAALLIELSKEDNTLLRSKAAYLLGMHSGEGVEVRLIELLDDPVPRVRRVACESLVRAQHAAPREKLLKLIAEPHAFVSWAARRALEQLPSPQWQESVLTSDNVRVFLVGSAALLAVDANRPTVAAMLNRIGDWLKDKKLSNADLLDMVRLVQIALVRGQVKPHEVDALRAQLSALYPGKDHRINRELVRVLVFLQEPTLAKRLVEQLSADEPLEEQLHIAMYTPFLKTGWNAALRGEVLAFFEQARQLEGGNSYRAYLTNATNDFLKILTPSEQLDLITSGAQTPVVTLGLVQNLPAKPTPEQLAALRKLDREVSAAKTDAGRELAKAILGVLARGDAESLAYMREVFESMPDRRPDVARAISVAIITTKETRKDDWPLLLRSLSVVDGGAGRDVLRALAKFSPQLAGIDGKVQRQVILLGLKLQEQGGQDAVVLLEHWIGKRQPVAKVGELGLEGWQNWFREKYPDLPDPVLPVEAAGTKWTYAGLVDFLSTPQGMQGDAKAGAAVYEKSLCIKCHRFGNRGEGIGPDLTDIRKRFQRKEILESVLFPSAVISDLFQSKVVQTGSGLTYQGIVGPGANGGITVFQSNSEKVVIEKDDIDEISPSKTSAMPEGLFNPLSLKEIADLFAYLTAAPPDGKVAGK